MKRITLSALLIACFTIPLSSKDLLRPRGDVNCDWEITIADVNCLLGSIIAGEKYHPLYRYAYDVNGDQEITVADVNLVIEALLGRELAPMPTFSGTLPVMYINTEGYNNIVSKEEYIHADWWIDAEGIEGYESLGSHEQPLGMLIKGRGNYTWNNMDKKPYRLKLDTKQSPLGMKSNRHFCLLAHDLWTNPLGFELSRRVGLAYTPEQEPVEVVLNGQYIGFYFLTDKIRVGKNRVNIVEQASEEEDPDLVTGGWLLEIGNRTEENQFFIYEGDGRKMGVEYHSPESLSTVQYDYIHQFIVATDSAIYAGDIDNCGWEKYIDIDTLACFYIVSEITDDIEAFSNSLFLHKQRGENTRLLFGPVWDFGCAFGHAKQEEASFIYENIDPSFTPHWLKEMVKYPRFQDAVLKRWYGFNQTGLNSIEQYMDSVVERVNAASVADSKRWPSLYIWFKDIKTHSEQFFMPQLRRKIKFLHEQWDDQTIIEENYDPSSPFEKKDTQ